MYNTNNGKFVYNFNSHTVKIIKPRVQYDAVYIGTSFYKLYEFFGNFNYFENITKFSRHNNKMLCIEYEYWKIMKPPVTAVALNSTHGNVAKQFI